MFSWLRRDARHEVIGNERTDDDAALAGRLVFEGVAIKMKWHQYDRHLTDLVVITCATIGSKKKTGIIFRMKIHLC